MGTTYGIGWHIWPNHRKFIAFPHHCILESLLVQIEQSSDFLSLYFDLEDTLIYAELSNAECLRDIPVFTIRLVLKNTIMK